MNITFIKALIFCFVIQFFGYNSKAQDKNLKFGLKVGPSINWLSIKTDGLEVSKNKLTFNYGLVTYFRIKGSNNYFLSTGLTVVSYNFTLNYPSAIIGSNQSVLLSSVENEITLRYIDIPFGLKMRSDEIGYSHIAGWFGLGSGVRINSSQKKKESYIEDKQSLSVETEFDEAREISQIAKVNFKVGGEWERKISGETFFVIGATYENGLTNILKGNMFELDENNQKTNLDKVNSDLARNGQKFMALPQSVVIHFGIFF